MKVIMQPADVEIEGKRIHTTHSAPRPDRLVIRTGDNCQAICCQADGVDAAGVALQRTQELPCGAKSPCTIGSKSKPTHCSETLYFSPLPTLPPLGT